MEAADRKVEAPDAPANPGEDAVAPRVSMAGGLDSPAPGSESGDVLPTGAGDAATGAHGDGGPPSPDTGQNPSSPLLDPAVDDPDSGSAREYRG
ncbi:hypothetical protein IV498_08010 [Paenarthrobacter sp. Z7-10]|nr:hypothetical protein [Paenarthrobacter sp. Z7-10]